MGRRRNHCVGHAFRSARLRKQRLWRLIVKPRNSATRIFDTDFRFHRIKIKGRGDWIAAARLIDHRNKAEAKTLTLASGSETKPSLIETKRHCGASARGAMEAAKGSRKTKSRALIRLPNPWGEGSGML